VQPGQRQQPARGKPVTGHMRTERTRLLRRPGGHFGVGDLGALDQPGDVAGHQASSDRVIECRGQHHQHGDDRADADASGDLAALEVATVNPGPFLTGFNDRMFQTYASWEDDPAERLFDYSKLAFPRAQFDPEAVYATMTAVAAGDVDTYRNLAPTSMIEETKSLIEAPWTKKTTDGMGSRPDQIQHSYDMQPETPVSSA
jgi:hypothetical protein